MAKALSQSSAEFFPSLFRRRKLKWVTFSIFFFFEKDIFNELIPFLFVTNAKKLRFLLSPFQHWVYAFAPPSPSPLSGSGGVFFFFSFLFKPDPSQDGPLFFFFESESQISFSWFWKKLIGLIFSFQGRRRKDYPPFWWSPTPLDR